MSDTGDQPPLEQRKKRDGRTGIPRSTARRDSTVMPPPPEARSRSSSRIRVKKATKPTTVNIPREEEDANLAASVVISTPGAEVAKRPRPEDSSPDSPSQGDDRQPRKYLALPPIPTSLRIEPQPSLPMPTQSSLKTLSLQPQKTYLPKSRRDPGMSPITDTSLSQPSTDGAVLTEKLQAPQKQQEDTDRQSQNAGSSHGSASWPRDSTSYADLASNVGVMSTFRPQSPQPGPSGVSYAAAAATPASPTSQANTQQNAPRTAQSSSAYPPIIVERLPNWTRHFNVLKEMIGHAPNARPMGKGVRFLPGSEQEFRTIQRYLTEVSNEDKSISWFCYSPPSEIPTKVAVRGLPLDTPPEEVVGALQDKGFPATRAKAIIPTKSRHGCTYFVQLDHLNREQLQELYGITELLCMPGISVEGWKPGRSPAQCHRCQAFGHASSNCHRPPRCVRCAGEHLARDCPKPVNDPPTCANCGKGHIARDRKCAVLRKEARKRGINLAPRRPSEPQLGPKIKRPTLASSVAPTGEAPRLAPSAAGEIHHVTSSAAPTPVAPCTTTVSGAPIPLISVSHMVDDDARAMQQFTETATQPQVTQTVEAVATADPSTLAPPANPPTRRGQSLPKKKKKKRKREARPVIAEPTASSTPQPRQTATTNEQAERTQHIMPTQEQQPEGVPSAPVQASQTALDFPTILLAIQIKS